MRRLAALSILVLGLVACADEPAPTAAREPEPQLDETRLGVYEAMTRELVGTEGFEWKKIVIVSELCGNAGSADGPEDCEDTLTPEEQDELARRLADIGTAVTFVEDPTPLYDEDWFTGTPEILIVRLGTIVQRGEGVEVGGSYGCGGLCGAGSTYVLEEKPAGWKVVGTTGPSWIA
ncbi:MAG: hypothetical protein ACRELC_04700 [Gemmatimonadota bacterium]